MHRGQPRSRSLILWCPETPHFNLRQSSHWDPESSPQHRGNFTRFGPQSTHYGTAHPVRVPVVSGLLRMGLHRHLHWHA